MSGGIVRDRQAEEKSRQAAANAINRLQTSLNQHLGERGHHGQLVLTVKFWDGGIPSFELSDAVTVKTE